MPVGHWSSASGDIDCLIRYMSSKNHVTKGSRNFITGSSSWYVTKLPSLVAIGTVAICIFVKEIQWFSLVT